MNAQQLKNSILQMAVSGKLVPQDPNDEPAALLLERIRAEKEELIRSGKIKREKNPSAIFRGPDGTFYEKIGSRDPVNITDELPFDIPDSWEWARWGSISESIQYGYNAPAQESGRIKMVRISDIQDGNVLWDSVPYCNIAEEDISTYLLKQNDILFARTGGTVGKSYLVKSVPDDAIYAGYLIRTRYSNSLSSEYLKLFMDTPVYWNQLKEGTTSTAQPNCNGKTLSQMLIPIPPIEEQNRIVEKIQEIEPIIEKYTIAEAHLDSLNVNFPEQLKKSILQQAVQGKLVPQDPTEEPASVLLERIRAEKEHLIAEARIKRDKNESFIYKRDNSYYEKINNTERCIDDELPFDIPDSWEWTRFSSLAIFENGDRSSKYPVESDYVEDGIPFFGAKDMGIKYMMFDSVRFISQEKFSQLGNGKLQDGDMICLLRGNVGKTRIFKSTKKYKTGFICAQMLIIRCVDSNLLNYVYAFLSSPNYIQTIESKITGTAVRQLPAIELAKMLIPLPPLSEQQRIVEKIEALMPMIKAL